ncbi:MAG: hypothetical protein Q8L56_09670 [Rhodocyclaceae bacterium]|nr:hypothetical protein [Rhodocyclaceae bacterium]
MVIVMDMSTGKSEKLSAEEAAAEEFGAFVDEVLNAGWLPQPEARLEMHEHEVKSAPPSVDTDEFLRNLYRNQE